MTPDLLARQRAAVAAYRASLPPILEQAELPLRARRRPYLTNAIAERIIKL